MPMLRVPAVSRLQKLHNVGVALQTLRERHEEALLHKKKESGPAFDTAHSVIHSVTAKDIVDGFRGKTLSLLWHLVSTYALDAAVSGPQLAMEANAVSKRWCWKHPQLLREARGALKAAPSLSCAQPTAAAGGGAAAPGCSGRACDFRVAVRIPQVSLARSLTVVCM